MNSKTMVVLSGGQDSTTCLWWALQNFDEVFAITFDYSQTHRVEIEAAAAVARLAGLDAAHHHVLTLGPVLQSMSPLTDRQQKLERYEDYASMQAIIGDRVEKTFVPMRNALFLTLAANWAVFNGCDSLVTGVCQADGANYPDCTQEFINDQRRTINSALGNRGNEFVIFAPLIGMTKAEIVNLAEGLGAFTALAFTHTAYDGAFPPGNDHASVLRAFGFEAAGLPDPLLVRAHLDNPDVRLPATSNYSGQLELINALSHSIRAAQEKLDTLHAVLFDRGVR